MDAFSTSKIPLQGSGREVQILTIGTKLFPRSSAWTKATDFDSVIVGSNPTGGASYFASVTHSARNGNAVAVRSRKRRFESDPRSPNIGE